jgi:hypothetical protein
MMEKSKTGGDSLVGIAADPDALEIFCRARRRPPR